VSLKEETATIHPQQAIQRNRKVAYHIHKFWRQTDEADERMERADAAENHANPEFIADGIGPPEAVAVEQLTDIVEPAMTLYEAGRE